MKAMPYAQYAIPCGELFCKEDVSDRRIYFERSNIVDFINNLQRVGFKRFIVIYLTRYCIMLIGCIVGDVSVAVDWPLSKEIII